MIQFKRGACAPSSVVAAVSVIALLAACKPATNSAAAAASTPTGGGLFGASAPAAPAAAPAAGGMATFTDPTENAFTISVPQGWNVKGGIQRSANSAKPWVQATSPDGATTISYGDPQIPLFLLPSPQHPAGSTVQAAGGQTPVEPYENGAQFAADYAQRAFGSACAGLTQTGSQPAPDFVQRAQDASTKLAAAIGVPPLQLSYDSAASSFSCQVSGAAYAVGVIDVTTDQPLSIGGTWGVAGIVSYRTPAANQAQADQFARQMAASMQPNPQWTAQMAQTAHQQFAAQQKTAAQWQATISGNAAEGSRMLASAATESNQRLNAGHAAFMQQFNAQGAARNAAFAQQQYNKQTGQDSEMRYINNQTCIAWYDAAHTRCRATAQQ